MITIVGTIADKLGAAVDWHNVPANHPGRTFDVEKRYSSVPSTEYRSVQASRIACDLNHDQPLGEVKYLERTDTKLYAVCEIDGSMLGEGPWFFSPHIRHCGGKEIDLHGLAVCKTPASVALGPIHAFPGTLHDAARHIVYQDGFKGQLVKRADEYNDRRRFRSGEPIRDPRRRA